MFVEHGHYGFSSLTRYHTHTPVTISLLSTPSTWLSNNSLRRQQWFNFCKYYSHVGNIHPSCVYWQSLSHKIIIFSLYLRVFYRPQPSVFPNLPFFTLISSLVVSCALSISLVLILSLPHDHLFACRRFARSAVSVWLLFLWVSYIPSNNLVF